MFSEALKFGQKVAASAGFTEDPDVVAEREHLEIETTERRQRLKVFFENESMVMEQVAERAEFAEDLDEDFDDTIDDNFDEVFDDDFDTGEWSDY